jgi:hypothetical protein
MNIFQVSIRGKENAKMAAKGKRTAWKRNS